MLQWGEKNIFGVMIVLSLHWENNLVSLGGGGGGG